MSIRAAQLDSMGEEKENLKVGGQGEEHDEFVQGDREERSFLEGIEEEKNWW